MENKSLLKQKECPSCPTVALLACIREETTHLHDSVSEQHAVLCVPARKQTANTRERNRPKPIIPRTWTSQGHGPIESRATWLHEMPKVTMPRAPVYDSMYMNCQGH